MIAKQAARSTSSRAGRLELGLGAGAFWEAIGAMAGPVRSGRAALEALEEATLPNDDELIHEALAFVGRETLGSHSAERSARPASLTCSPRASRLR